MHVVCKWEKKHDVRSGMIIHDIVGSTHKAGPMPVLRDASATPREQRADVSRFWFANPLQRGLRRRLLTRTTRR